MVRSRRIALLAFASGAAITIASIAPAWAQTRAVPGSLQPGRAEAARPAPVSTATSAIDALFPQAVPAAVRPEPEMSDTRRLRVVRVVLEGSTRIATTDVDRLASPYVGRELTGRDLKALANMLTARYVEAGFVLSEVYVPEQEVRSGTVRLRAIEGFVTQLAFNAADRPVESSSVLAGYGAQILASRPLARSVLERALLLMNEVGDTVAVAALSPAANEPGGYNLTINVHRKRIAGNVALSNRGNRWLGPQRLAGEVYFNSDLFGGARTGIRTQSTLDRELGIVTLVHEQHLGASGAKLFLSTTAARSYPSIDLGSAGELSTRSGAGNAFVTYPIVRGRDWNMVVRGGYSAFRGDSKAGSALVTSDRIDAGRIGLTVDGLDRFSGVNLVDLEASGGRARCARSGAGLELCSRTLLEEDKRFAKFNLYAARLQSLGAGWSVLLAAHGQHANDRLTISEQFGFGGEQFGRAFDTAELLGDSGIGFKLELRRNARLPGVDIPVTAYAFFDAGRVWRQATPAVPGTPAVGRTSEDGRAAGLGLRAQLASGWAGYAEYAQPIGLDVASEGNRHARVFGGVSYSF